MLRIALIAIAAIGLVWSVYETHDEIYDDDRDDSVIDRPLVAAGAALFFLGALLFLLFE